MMNKVNFDNLKNLKTPDSWIENALSIPNTQQKKSPILMLFSTKSSRLIAAAACLILVSAVALTIFLTQDSVTPPIDPDYIATEQTVETQDVTQAQSDSSEQTHSSGDNTQEPTNESKPNADDYQSIEPTEVVASNATQNAGGSTVNNQNTTRPNLKPIVTPIVKETVRATEKTDANHADSANKPSVKPTITQTIKPTVKPTLAPVVKPTQKPTAKPVVKPTQKPTTPAVKPTTKPVVQPTTPPATEPTEAPTANPTSKPNNPPAMLMLPTIPSPEKFPVVDFDGPPSVTPTMPQSPPEVSPTEPTEPPFVLPTEGEPNMPSEGEPPYVEQSTTPQVSPTEPTEPPEVSPSEPTDPPYVEPDNPPVSPTEGMDSTTNPNELPHYIIDVTNTIYCHIDDPVCVGYIDPPVNLSDDYYFSLYDNNLNVIGYYEHYYYSEYLKASLKPIYQENKIRCEYSLKYREMVTSIGTYYYCFYNETGKIVYWGKMIVYQ